MEWGQFDQLKGEHFFRNRGPILKHNTLKVPFVQEFIEHRYFSQFIGRNDILLRKFLFMTILILIQINVGEFSLYLA
jgi:hypothetical protein